MDVLPMVKAVVKFQDFYKNQNIDVFKIAISAPGCARRMIFNSGKPKFALVDDLLLYKTLKANLFGGPPIVFNRWLEAGKSMGTGKDTCKRIFGMDANALYPSSFMCELPSSINVHRTAETDFKPVINTSYIDQFVWLDFVSEQENLHIKHKFNSGYEKNIWGFKVDGWLEGEKVVYEYDGCFYHGCDKCNITQGKSEAQLELLLKRRQRTQCRKKFLESVGYTVNSITECYFKKHIAKHCNHIRDRYVPSYYRTHKRPVTQEQILEAVVNGSLYGYVEIHTSIPPKWPKGLEKDISTYDYFKEYPPLFVTTLVNETAWGDHMRAYCEEHNISKKT